MPLDNLLVELTKIQWKILNLSTVSYQLLAIDC